MTVTDPTPRRPRPGAAGDPPSSPTMPLGVAGFTYADLYEPAKLARAARRVRPLVRRGAPEHHARFAAYRACKGEGMTPAGAERGAARRRAVRGPLRRQALRRRARARRRSSEMVRRNDPLWRFKKDFAKKRVLRDGAGKGWTLGARAGGGGRAGGAPGDDAGPRGRHDRRGAHRRHGGAAALRGRRHRAQGGEGRRRAVDRRAARARAQGAGGPRAARSPEVA